MMQIIYVYLREQPNKSLYQSPFGTVCSSSSPGVSLPLEQPLMGEEVSGLASLEPLLPLTPPLPLTLEALDTLALPPASGVCSLVLKLETLLMLITFFISLRVALGVALRLTFASPAD